VPTELRAVLAVAALLAVAWTIAMAPFQGADELEHFGYVQRLGETGRPPSPTTGTRAISSAERQAVDRLNLFSLRGIAGAREAWNPIDQRDWTRIERGLGDDAYADGDGPNPAAKNPPLYYVVEAVPYRLAASSGLFSQLFAARLVGVVCLVAAVWLTWLLAAELFAARWVRLLAAAVVALHPGLASAAGIVNPDILLTVTWTGFLLAGVRLLTRGPSRWRLAALGGFAVASVLTHGRGLPLLLPGVLVLGLLLWRLAPDRRRRVGAWAAGATVVVLGLAAGAVASGAYGGSLAAERFSVPGFIDTTWQFYLPRLPFMGPRIGPDYGFRQVFVETFYGTYGSLEIHQPPWVMRFLQIGSVAGLAIVVATLLARRRALAGRWAIPAFLGLSVVSLVLFLHVASYLALAGAEGDPVIVGRYLLPGVSVLGLAVAFVAASLPRRAGAVVAGAVIGTGCLLQIAALGLTVTRFYA
jgi:4-amino-4-deoxy-L-arabinose transferase-like glycosyltransferase